jgi:ribosomal protein L37AE/L43A
MTEQQPILEECPRCISEKLVQTIGNIAVCPNCDLVVVQTSTTVDVELPPEPKVVA